MSLKQRIELLEKQVSNQGYCQKCGGLHTGNWADMLRTAVSGTTVCGCSPCCQWIADLNAAALADQQPIRRRHFTDPKGR